MYKPVIYMGSDYIYNEKKCDSIEKKIKLKKALKEIENEIKKKGVEVIKPVRRDKNKICRSLWVRDSSFTIHNQVYLMPQMVKSDDRDRSKQIASEVDVIPYVMDGEIVPESVNLDGGDIYIMSEKSVGNDWLSRKKVTLRHGMETVEGQADKWRDLIC